MRPRWVTGMSFGRKFMRRGVYATFLFFSLCCITFELHRFLGQGKFVLELNEKLGYLVDDPGCRILDYDPLDKSIRHLVRAPEPVKCPGRDPLTYIFNRTLRFNESTFIHYGIVNVEDLWCCWSKVTRGLKGHDDGYPTVDNEIRLGKCHKFHNTTEIREEFIFIHCNYNGKTIYKNVHVVPMIKPEVEAKFQKHWSGRPPSILLLGIDSASRLNFHRSMPHTKATLDAVGAVEFLGYNKVGDNTLPNLMPLLAGISLKQAQASCWPSRNHTFDKCPFMWKYFNDADYVTVFAEDEPEISTFNYHKLGFSYVPTDYYLRPLFVAGNNLLSVLTRDNMKVCYGSRQTTQIVLDYLIDMLTMFRNVPYFALGWVSNLSHQDGNDLTLADVMFSKFLKHMFESGALNQTLVIFFSDHGMRWGKIRETPIGWLEERLPFLFIRPPELGNDRTSDLLEYNRYRLTTPFDLHVTLMNQLWSGDTPNAYSLEGRGVNLLEDEVPLNRTCESAGIRAHWCACAEEADVSTSDYVVKKMVDLAVDYINQRLKPVPVCAQLSVLRILSSRALLIRNTARTIQQYVVAFTTYPGHGMFDTTLRYNEITRAFALVGDISRINVYGNQGACVNDPTLKLFCYCV